LGSDGLGVIICGGDYIYLVDERAAEATIQQKQQVSMP
jgi:hypothetical protein